MLCFKQINNLVKRLMSPYITRDKVWVFLRNCWEPIGTLRSNKRQNPKHIISKKLKKGERI